LFPKLKFHYTSSPTKKQKTNSKKTQLQNNRKILSSSKGLVQANKIRTQKLEEEEEKMNQKSTQHM